jgi:hypothetical protein
MRGMEQGRRDAGPAPFIRGTVYVNGLTTDLPNWKV